MIRIAHARVEVRGSSDGSEKALKESISLYIIIITIYCRLECSVCGRMIPSGGRSDLRIETINRSFPGTLPLT